jgi:hypothetical protein
VIKEYGIFSDCTTLPRFATAMYDPSCNSFQAHLQGYASTIARNGQEHKA